MAYWFALIIERGPRGAIKKPTISPEPSAPASWKAERASEQIPRVGDRVFFMRPSKPLSRVVHFIYIGLAEINSVTPSDDPQKPLIGFTTITPLQGYVPRGDPSADRIESIAHAVIRRARGWGSLSGEDALALFRYVDVAKDDDVDLPAWFSAAETVVPNVEERVDPLVIDERKRVSRLIVERQGQGDFRAALLNAYGRQCAMTGCAVEAVLEAAHVVPYLGPRTNDVTNGMLLRADIHTLFDLNLIIVEPDRLTIQVSAALQNSEYWQLNGAPLRLPNLPSDRPTAVVFRERNRLLNLPAVRDA